MKTPMIANGSTCRTAAFFSVKMSSKMKRTRNGMAPAVEPKRIMHAMAPAKYGQTYGRR